uniref:ArsR family transcriptional regulator n=1 Tax=Flavobacterium sp. TaxID=239 RepID=UPI00404A3115
MLGNLITSKTRLRLLVKFFMSATNEGYLRGLANEMQESTNAIRKELNNLSESGFIIRKDEENKITYQANQNHPFFSLLQQIVRKYVGLDTIVEMVVNRMGDVHRVWLIGDYAKGIDTGVVEVVIEGEELNETYIDQLTLKIENTIDKKLLIHINSNTSNGLIIFEKELD